jgi:hypothetical protein
MGTPGQARNAQRKQEGAMRRAQVMQLRASGMQPTAIAEQLHLTLRSVTRHISRALADVVTVATTEYRALEATRLDALIHAYWDKALDGDLPAAYFIVKIIGQRMALFGLVQPPTREDDMGDKFAALIMRLAGQRVAEEPDPGPTTRSQAQEILDYEVAASQKPGWARALAVANGHYDDQGGDMPPND